MTQHDPAAWMLSLSDEPATLTVLASLTDVRQRGAFQAQYVHSRNGCAWADGTGDGSQWSPAEVAAWCVVNPADAIDLAHYAAQDAARLRKRLATILRLGHRRAGEQGGGQRRRHNPFHHCTPFSERTPKDVHRSYSLLTLLSAMADEPCLNGPVGN